MRYTDISALAFLVATKFAEGWVGYRLLQRIDDNLLLPSKNLDIYMSYVSFLEWKVKALIPFRLQ